MENIVYILIETPVDWESDPTLHGVYRNKKDGEKEMETLRNDSRSVKYLYDLEAYEVE